MKAILSASLFLLGEKFAVGDEAIATLPDSTQLRGTTDGVISSFKGVRYAEAPVGDLRWRPPVLYSYKEADEGTVIDATTFGAHCIQSTWPNGTEDCLFLNVFAPSIVPSEPVPVLIFIHGGSYTAGSAKFYQAADMVRYWDGKAVVVTLDYRLNVFGFLGARELKERDTGSQSTGNYGLQDQRMGFTWVRQNIGMFRNDKYK
jgi:carboxylesterase type B